MKKWNFSVKKWVNRWKTLSKKKKVIVFFLAGIVLISGSIFLIKGRSAGKMPQAGANIQEATAQTGDISNTIVGTGNLEVDDSQSITIPSGIIVEEVKVESGDHVSKGDVLAVLNQVSVLDAVETVQEEIEALDKQINSARSSTETETVTSKVSGRIKKIYVENDSDAADCMIENGALILMSIDGEMAVDLDDASDLSEGDAVTVILSDETEEEGTIETVNGDTCTVTFSDENAQVDEKVKVKTEDGKSLGRGEAYIHQKLEITATGGTVSKIHVAENDKVSSGTTLLTLKISGQSVEYQQLTAEREELAKSLQKLVSMSKTGVIIADMDGTIGEVNVSAANETSGSSADSSGQTGSLSYQTEDSEETGIAALKAEKVETVFVSNTQKGYTLMNLSSTSEKESESQTETIKNEEDANKDSNSTKIQLQITDTGTSNQSTLVLAPPKTGNTPQTEITAADGSYTGKISWNPGDSVFAAETTYQADVTLSASENYIFDSSSISKVQTGLLSGVTVSADGMTLTFHLTFSATEKSEQTVNNNDTEKNTSAGSEQSDSGKQTDETISGNASANGKSAGSQTSGGAVSYTGSSSAGSSSSSGTEDSSYSSEITVFTLASDENMLLCVSVDELDINSVSDSQEAEVTLDAIEGETFTGTVTKVGNSASSASGGVAKYTVQITIPKDEQMKAGMNASATIVIENKENVVTIPVNALQEKGSKVFVYTKKDSDGNLSGEQEVTTGLSDGDMVEITEGLQEGDVVYYQKTGSTSSESFGGKSGMGGGSGDFPGEGFKGSGDFPDGADPSGRTGGNRGGTQ